MNEGTGATDAAYLASFVHRVGENFEIVEELVSLVPLKDITDLRPPPPPTSNFTLNI
jgi:hypothetical protein